LHGITSGIDTRHRQKLRERLHFLHRAQVVTDLNLPGWRLHGFASAEWSIVVNGNWRLTFCFEQGDVYLLDYTLNNSSCITAATE
jgi:proteic killer suppression protein